MNLVPKTMKKVINAAVAILMMLACCGTKALTQEYVYALGSPSFTTADRFEIGFVNVGNGNLHIQIPLAAPAQRGSLKLVEQLVYDSRIWSIETSGTNQLWQPANVPNSKLGWRFLTGNEAGNITYNTVPILYKNPSSGCLTDNAYANFVWTDVNGTAHTFSQLGQDDCKSGGTADRTSGYADDSSGYFMDVSNFPDIRVFGLDGTQVYPSGRDTTDNYFSTDSNGNVIDTLGRTPVLRTTSGNLDYYDVLNSANVRKRVTVTSNTFTVSSAFSQGGTNFPQTPESAPQTIALPDNSNYAFDYDSYGELKSVTLPTGGKISFEYTNFIDPSGNQNRWVSSRTSPAGTWQYQYATCGSSCVQTTVLKPDGSSDTYTFTIYAGAWLRSAVSKDSNGKVVATSIRDYDFSSSISAICGTVELGVFVHCDKVAYVRPTSVTNSIPTIGGSQLSTRTSFGYDNAAKGTANAIKEWKFFVGSAPTNPDRETDIQYQDWNYSLSGSSTNFTVPIRKPKTVSVYAGAGTTDGSCSSGNGCVAQTKYTYNPSPTSVLTGIEHHDDSNPVNTVRINNLLSSVQQWTGSGLLQTSAFTYDSTGQMLSSADSNFNTTNFSYTDNFFNDPNTDQPISVQKPTNAYVTTVTLPLDGATGIGYYYGSGKTAISTDSNGASTKYHYTDSLDRPTQVIDGAGGWQQIAYSGALDTDTYVGITDAVPSTSCSGCLHQHQSLDSLGRVQSSALLSDPEGAAFVDYSHDAFGRVTGSTNPHRSQPASTDGTTYTAYDSLGRAIQIISPDGNSVSNLFGDAAGTATQLCGTWESGIGYPDVPPVFVPVMMRVPAG